ncbi:MAG: lysophospholipase [Planctomycetes bacterium]|nr:lysophospholipase [Planctomycetota bacterium]
MIVASRFRTIRVASVTIALVCACAPVPAIETPTTDELGQFITNLLLRPEITCELLRATFAVEYLPIVETPDQAGMTYEEHWVSTEDGELLRVWYLPTRLDRGTVVFSLGASGAMPCYLFVTRLLVHNGWSVVMYEYRGFGASSGEPNVNALHTDLAAVLDWTVDYTGEEKVTLFGVSLGTLPSVAVAVDRPDIVNAVVLDSPASMGLEVARFARALRDQTQAIIDQLASPLVPEELAAALEQPLLVFLSELDWITPPWSVQIIYERAAGPKELVTFIELGHAAGPYHDTGTYTFHLERFLSRVWRQYTPPTVEPQASEPD